MSLPDLSSPAEKLRSKVVEFVRVAGLPYKDTRIDHKGRLGMASDILDATFSLLSEGLGESPSDVLEDWLNSTDLVLRDIRGSAEDEEDAGEEKTLAKLIEKRFTPEQQRKIHKLAEEKIREIKQAASEELNKA